MAQGIEKGTLYYVTDVNKIAVDDDFNVRTDFALKDLRRSIEGYGVRQPLVCRKGDNKDQPFVLQDGHRRLMILTEIQESGEDVHFPVILVDGADDVDPTVDLAIATMQRKALNAMEESDLIARLLDADGVNKNTDVAEIIGRSSAYVGQKLSFQKLSPKCQKAVRDGKITADHALDIVRQEGDEVKAQDKRLAKILKQLEVKATAAKAAKAATGKSSKAKATRAKAQKDKKAAGKAAKRAAGGRSRPSKKELTGLAQLYEVRFGLLEDDKGAKLFEAPIEILSSSLNYAAGEITEEELFQVMASYVGLVSDDGEFSAEWGEVRDEVEAKQEAEREAIAAQKKAEKDAAKAKAKKTTNGAPKAPGKPKGKKKSSKKKSEGKHASA
jgi:ParB/RepB/Spo0J family partition protein